MQMPFLMGVANLAALYFREEVDNKEKEIQSPHPRQPSTWGTVTPRRPYPGQRA